MADTMQFDLVSPERSLVSGQVTSVHIPGANGYFMAMPGHAPMITSLRLGVLTVIEKAGSTKYAVSGGFAEVTTTGTSVLTEKATPASEMTGADIDAMVAEAEENAIGLSGTAKEASNMLLADLAVMRTVLGF